MISRRDFLVRTGGLAALGAVAGASDPQSVLARVLQRGQEGNTFNLDLTITGLAMFVPAPSDAPTRMDVLLPKGPKDSPHYPLVFHDDDTSPLVDLKGKTLDLRACKGAESSVPDPKSWPDILSVEEILGLYKVPHKGLGNRDKQQIPNLAASVILPPGERTILFSEDVRGPWSALAPNESFGKKFGMRLAWYVIYRITGIQGNTLPWKVTNLDGSASTTPTAPSGKSISLVISNNSSTRNPTQRPLAGNPPAQGTAMCHFRSYYSLYAGLVTDDKSLPDLKYMGTDGSGSCDSRNTAYNCLPSGGH